MATYTNPTNLPPSNYSGPGSQYNVGAYGTPYPFEQDMARGEEWLSGYTGAISGQPTYQQLQDQYANKYFIPQLREEVATYGDLAAQQAMALRALPKNVAATTTESLVSDPARARIIEARSQPMQEALSTYTTAGEAAKNRLSTAEQARSLDIGAEERQMAKELSPWEYGYDLMNIQASRQFTGWDNQMNRELNKLLSNQASGLAWTQGEAERASKLQQIKENYQNTLNLMEKSGEQISKFFSYL